MYVDCPYCNRAVEILLDSENTMKTLIIYRSAKKKCIFWNHNFKIIDIGNKYVSKKEE